MSHPEDRFDRVPDDLYRIGAHRTPKAPGSGWRAFAWAALATLVLVIASILGLRLAGFDIALPFVPSGAEQPPPAAAPPAAEQTADPVLDPSTIDPTREIRTTVFNGTTTPELQNSVGDALEQAGWTIDTRALASTDDVTTTTVFYSDSANEDVARGIAVALGVGDVQFVSADTFPGTPLTVVIGEDYPGAVPQG